MIGVPKEVVLKDLHEVLAKAMEETGDFDVENYCFFICPTLFHTLKIWLLDDNINAGLTKFKGVEISLIKHTQYFYLKYSGNRIKRIEKIFAPTETIKKYIQTS